MEPPEEAIDVLMARIKRNAALQTFGSSLKSAEIRDTSSRTDPTIHNAQASSSRPHISAIAAAAVTNRKNAAARTPDVMLCAPGKTPSEEPPPIMRHRLRNKFRFWQSFATSALVLRWILHGFPLIWLAGIPDAAMFPNHNSAHSHQSFVDMQIQDYLAAQSVQIWDHVLHGLPHVVSPLGVDVKGSGADQKLRLIWDGRYVNDHILIPPFKYEDLSHIHEIIRPNDFLIVTDFSRGYHHIDLDVKFLTYFGFEWRGIYYVFTSLPFGLASACWAFTKVTRELLYKWRRQKLRCTSYLDDGLHAHSDLTRLQFIFRAIIEPDIQNCGFLLNRKKTKAVPAQVQQYIGMILDTRGVGCMLVPDKRYVTLLSLISSALRSPNCCSRAVLQKITGCISSMYWAFGPFARLMTLSLHNDMKLQQGSIIHLSTTALVDLEFWYFGFKSFEGTRRIWEPRRLSYVIFTDAAGKNLQSHGGWAGWMVENSSSPVSSSSIPTPHPHVIIARGIWANNEDSESSTFLELQTVLNVILSFNRERRLSGHSVLVQTDNQGVYFIINKAGSRTPRINDVAKHLLWYCFHEDIQLRATWIPRDLNTWADYYSKLNDSADWKLNPLNFEALEKEFGFRFELDLFASYTNHQVSAYYSFFWTPTTQGVDAFQFSGAEIVGVFHPSIRFRRF